MEREYISNFSRIQRFNYYEKDILRIVEIIEKLISYYEVTYDVALLQIPYNELVEGNGKVRWTTYGVKILWPFKCTFGIRPRRLIRMISQFNYYKLRLYVKEEYEKISILNERTATNIASSPAVTKNDLVSTENP